MKHAGDWVFIAAYHVAHALLEDDSVVVERDLLNVVHNVVLHRTGHVCRLDGDRRARHPATYIQVSAPLPWSNGRADSGTHRGNSTSKLMTTMALRVPSTIILSITSCRQRRLGESGPSEAPPAPASEPASRTHRREVEVELRHEQHRDACERQQRDCSRVERDTERGTGAAAQRSASVAAPGRPPAHSRTYKARPASCGP